MSDILLTSCKIDIHVYRSGIITSHYCLLYCYNSAVFAVLHLNFLAVVYPRDGYCLRLPKVSVLIQGQDGLSLLKYIYLFLFFLGSPIEYLFLKEERVLDAP